MDLSGRRVLIYGLGRSGKAAARAAAGKGAKVLLLDENPAVLDEALRELSALAPEKGSVEDGGDWMILSPGIPGDSPAVTRFRQGGGKVISELELAFRLTAPGARWIAVTGTNGKTTTTAWIGAMFEAAGKPALVGGNIGNALANLTGSLKQGDWVVAEVSSFQLEETEKFKPGIAVVTNLRPDHLDRYKEMNAYKAAKQKIGANQDAGDIMILNADESSLRGFEGSSAARQWRTSTQDAQKMGVWVAGNAIRFDRGEGPQDLVAVGDVGLRGPHNLENALSASAAALAAGLSPAAVAEALKSFKGVEHRLELCGTVKGVRFVNDSKGTNVDSVEKALQSFEQPVHLILGGRDKAGDFKRLVPLIRERVAGVCLIGEAADTIAAQLGQVKPLSRATGLEQAVAGCFQAAKKGEWVVLSPGCASFDMFENYEARGRAFKKAVAELAAKEGA